MTGAASAAVIAIAREKQVTVSAAGVAFYAFNAMIALAVVVYASVTLFGTGNALAGTLQTLTGFSAAEFRTIFERLGSDVAGQWRALVLGVVIAVWSSLSLFRALERVFVDVYEIRKHRSLSEHLIDSLLVLGAAAVGLIAMVAVGSLFLFRTSGLLLSAVGPLPTWLAVLGIFLPMYYTFSGADASIRDVLPGAAFAATCWTVSAVALRLYVGVSESVNLYGIVGAVLLVLTWLYVVALGTVFGVVLNAYIADSIDADLDWYPFRE